MSYFLIDKKYFDNISKQLKSKSSNKFNLLKELALYNRINTITTLYKAKHGWLGASLSITEILTNLYFDIKQKKDEVLLSKGHAAVMQYSCLAGLGIISTKDLLKYKYPKGPQAHTDIMTKGIKVNSGSLGQTLSKACGLAYQKKNKIFVILGDGELQEGQNFEAFMTLIHHNINNVIPIIDKNNIQSDSNVSDIKNIKNLEMVLKGFGFKVFKIQGNNIQNVNEVLQKVYKEEKPSIIIAETKKGAGISFTESNNTKRKMYTWHSAIPNNEEYKLILKEFSENLINEELKNKIENFLSDFKNSSKVCIKNKFLSTGTSFSKSILKFSKKYKNIYELDADLEKSCKLTDFAKKYPKRFIEIGISEQDMVSFAGGLALNRKIPVVNTYSNFFRRCFENIYINATEKKKIIYAGHYSGLCYATDGKTHQSTGDIAMMRSIPNMLVFYPTFNEEINQILDWYLTQKKEMPIYFKLHRTPVNINYNKKIDFKFGYGIYLRNNNSENCIITSGPHLSNYSVQAADITKNIDVISVSTQRFLNQNFVKTLTEKYKNIFIIQETIEAGSLFDELNICLSKLKYKNDNLKIPNIFYKSINDFTFSDLNAEGLYNYFKLNTKHIVSFINKII